MDEPAEEIFDINPQDEESKDNLTMPQRVYIAAQQLDKTITTVNKSLKAESDLLQESITQVFKVFENSKYCQNHFDAYSNSTKFEIEKIGKKIAQNQEFAATVEA